MAFNQISVNLGGMARCSALGYSVLLRKCCAVRIVLNVDASAVFAQVHDPRNAATSTRVSSNIETRSGEFAFFTNVNLRAFRFACGLTAAGTPSREHNERNGCHAMCDSKGLHEPDRSEAITSLFIAVLVGQQI